MEVSLPAHARPKDADALPTPTVAVGLHGEHVGKQEPVKGNPDERVVP